MFKNINDFSVKDRRFFRELVELYIRLIYNFSIKHNIDFEIKKHQISEEIRNRLIELNIFENGSKEEEKLLSTILKKDVHKSFISAIQFNIDNINKIGGLLDNIDPSKRAKTQLKNKNSENPIIVDLFAGAGGLSLGFTQEGFKIDLANDFEDVCVETFRYNHPEVNDNNVIFGDIREFIHEIENYVSEEIDVIVGGPPCQGFSSANQQRIIDDPRNELYKYFIEAVEKLSPKFVVMENVKGMLPYSDQIIEDYQQVKTKKGLKNLKYIVDFKLLVSDDFGVAQKRERLIFIGIREDVVKAKNITPTDIFNKIKKQNINIKKHVLKDALDYIKELKAPRIKNMTEVDDDVTGGKVRVNPFNGTENSYLKLINQNRNIEYIFNHKARYTNDINYEIYKTLEQGEDSTNEKIKHIMPYKHRNHVFKDKYFKLIEDRPSRTITAHLRMDCHSHIHPRQVRAITPREAARIQSFPDDYLFLGSYLKTYMQIGNAVPPVMARGIAKAIKKYL